jgi:hypothetical protein
MTATAERKTLDDLQEDPPAYAKETCDLFRWSVNYDHPTPAALFLDIIGYSDEEYGEPMFSLKDCPERFGYMEIGMLADALKEYADDPTRVMEYVKEYLAAESE